MRFASFGWLKRRMRASRFRNDQRGSMAVTFALSLIPISLAVGAAVDYSFANGAKSKLDAVADAAALSAVNKMAMGMSVGQAKQTALDMFNSMATGIPRVTIHTVKASVDDTTSGRTASVSYTATTPTAVMGLMSIKQAQDRRHVVRRRRQAAVHGLLPAAGQHAVHGRRRHDRGHQHAGREHVRQCAFACHDLSSTPNDYYGLAKKLGVQMRIDVVRQATQKLMDTATRDAGGVEPVPHRDLYVRHELSRALGLRPSRR